ncbi:NAD(P)/FAD-dependent oxidoreductase [Alloacidobacterium dinghuense]|uniref:NADH:ubiquinone reductase (non-electrogenic) n=1 Tax=Alloacidobacterium dinghuense TaxID=2763107 RepID=A0A7G8BGJ8_9BACT|nr:NAD(P)/FAD-dependent oxidoreductase [Alloacidobacterium dinghuense]QNI31668.1 NAD(P)/FAD-dependent oxidoreductase [Alloacidobacterium dinghuense]
MSARTRKQVLILGGGFGGLYTALGLEQTLARDSDVQVTLVNRENFTLFTPMLHEVAASDLDMTHIVNPVRKLLSHVVFFHGEVVHIDLASKHVTVVHGPERHSHELNYDYLVLALGSTTNFFGLPGLERRGMTMKSLSDAIHLRNQLIDMLEEADFECAAGERPNLLTIVVAGGGFAGVETVAAVNDFLRESIRFYPHLTAAMLRVVLAHPGDVILPELGPKLGAYAQKKLSERKVEIRVNTKVVCVDEDVVDLSDGSTIPTKTMIWTAGTSANPLIATLPCKLDRGRIVTNEYLEVQDWPGVWALGDCASITDHKTGRPHPPTAQHALRQGKTVAKNVTATIRGGTKTRFSFSTLGLLAAIGRRTGVANILGINFSGFVAWFLWRTIYLSKLPRLEKKVRVALDWTLDLLFSKDLVHLLDLRAPTVSQIEQEVDTSLARSER